MQHARARVQTTSHRLSGGHGRPRSHPIGGGGRRRLHRRPDINVFHEEIAWLAEAGVTKGCNPGANTEFCPSDNVTREQISAFMRRLAQYMGAEDGTPARADHATTADNATTADSAATADDAATLDGVGPDSHSTIIDGINCDGCEPIVAGESTELLELVVIVPSSGVIALSYSASVLFDPPTDDYVGTWLTVNGDETSFDGCGVSAGAEPLGTNVIPGSKSYFRVDGQIDAANLSSDVVIEVPEGNHTIRLCGASNVASYPDVLSLTAIWSARGSAAFVPGVPG